MPRWNSICEKTATKKMLNKSSCLNSVQGSEWTKYCTQVLSKNYYFSKRMPRNQSVHYQECHCTMAGLTSTVEQQVKLSRKRQLNLSISSGNRFCSLLFTKSVSFQLYWNLGLGKTCHTSSFSNFQVLHSLTSHKFFSFQKKKILLTVDPFCEEFIFVAALHSTQTVECLLAFHLF